jgi:hypothetical protein
MNKAQVGMLCVLVLSCSATVAFAQAPGWSRGQQNLAITYDECVRRAPAALQAEGYRRDDSPGGNFAAGIKGVHTAVIICSPAPDAKMLVHVVVASNGDGGGSERQRLQAQMERSGTAGGGGGIAGSWTYRDGSFSDTHVFAADGTVHPPSNPNVTAKWSVEGGELVVRWTNGWINRYRLPGVSGQLSGTSYGPSGERRAITLTRQ